MQKIGQTLKMLRKSRNLSQREVAQNVMDFSYYCRVENDKVNISFAKLTRLMEKLGISMEEFLFLNKESWRNEEEDLQKLILKAFYSNKIKTLEKLKSVCIQKYNYTKHWNDRYSYILCTYLLNRIKGNALEQEHINELLEHLNSLSYFTKIDVAALGTFYDVLPSSMVFYLFEKMFLEKKRHSAFEISEKYVLLFYFNMIDLAFSQENYKLVHLIFKLAKEEFNEPLNILAKLLFNYYDGIFLILSKTDIKKGTNMAKNTIKVFETCGLEQPAKIHKDILKRMKKKELSEEVINAYFK